jgi:hypothetical protein
MNEEAGPIEEKTRQWQRGMRRRQRSQEKREEEGRKGEGGDCH